MKKIFLLFLFFLSVLNSLSQNKRVIDSLTALTLKSDDTTKANLYNLIAAQWAGSDPEKNKEFGQKIYAIGETTGFGKYKAIGLFKLGIYYYTIGRMDSAQAFYIKAMALAKSNKRFQLEAYVHQNLGLVYERLGDYESAIKENIAALKVFETINNDFAVSSLKNNIGIIYIKQHDFILAEKYILEAFEYLSKTSNAGGLCYVYQNLGLIESNKENYSKSNLLYRKALSEFKSQNDLNGQVGVLQNLAMNFLNLNQPDSANIYNTQSIVISASLDNLNGLYSGYLNQANVYLRFFKSPKIALRYLDSAASIKELHDLPEYKIAYYQTEAEYNLCYGDKVKGFLLMDRFLTLKDSLLSEENIQSIKNLNTKYDTEKKDLQIQNQSLEISAKEKENAAKNKILIFGAFGLCIVAVFGFIAFSNFKKAKKANSVINNQKEMVELQKEEITQQKVLVDEKQKEIIDSINYAQKIQSAVLTSEEVWKKISPEHFIIFLPKDIVSGDFYWAYNTVNNRSVFALADCTGHGVPGGFMSMLGNSFLNELVVENKMFKSDIILNKLRDKIIKALGQKGADDRKDGMDMCLCVWNKLENTLEFSGANNSLWIIRNKELLVFNGDKMPIGQFHNVSAPFTSQLIALQKNDLVVLSTDGFADQFGGESGKKLKSKNLKEFLVKNSDTPLSDQKNELTSLFSNWKGQHQQVDDVSLIMIKVI